MNRSIPKIFFPRQVVIFASTALATLPAAAVTFNSLDDYLGATPSATLLTDFEALSTGQMTFPDNPLVVSPNLTVISSSANLRIYGAGISNVPSATAVSDGYSDTLTLIFNNGVTSVGFDYLLASTWGTDPMSIKAYDSTEGGLVLFDSGLFDGPVSVNTGNYAFLALSEIGVIRRVEIGGPGVAAPGVDNIYATPIPEPSTYAIAAGALVLGVAILRRRIRK